MKTSIKNAVLTAFAMPMVTTHFVGSPGCGKTHAPKEMAEALGKYVLVVPCQNMPVEDTARMPVVDGGIVSFATPEMWHPRPNMVIILDELLKAPDDVVNAFLPLAYGSPRTFMGHTYPDDTIVIITSNSAEMRVGDKMKPHINNRVCTIEIADPSTEEATQTMLDRGFDARIIEWVKNVPQALVSYDPLAKEKAATELANYLGFDERLPRQKFVSMRALENVSHSLKCELPGDMRHMVFAGLIGEKAASSFNLFLKELQEFIPLADMVNKPVKAKVPKHPFDKRLAAMTAASGLNEDNYKQLLVYVSRLGGEFRHLFITQAARKEVSSKMVQSGQHAEWLNAVMELV